MYYRPPVPNHAVRAASVGPTGCPRNCPAAPAGTGASNFPAIPAFSSALMYQFSAASVSSSNANGAKKSAPPALNIASRAVRSSLLRW